MPVITLTTDFGSLYPAALKAVILKVNDRANIIDITHSIPHADIRAGAFALYSVVEYFPEGTVHVAVVDPGVGTRRRPLAIRAGGQYFIGPDNGLLIPAARRLGEIEVYDITNENLIRNVSSTFHGRDIFAPVGAHLSTAIRSEEGGTRKSSLRSDLPGVHNYKLDTTRKSPLRSDLPGVHNYKLDTTRKSPLRSDLPGVHNYKLDTTRKSSFRSDLPGVHNNILDRIKKYLAQLLTGAHVSGGIRFEEVGSKIDDFVDMDFEKVEVKDKSIKGEVIFIDDFGNIITNIAGDIILEIADPGTQLCVFGSKIPFLHAYGEVDIDDALTLIGSHGFLEISINQGSAAHVFGIRNGDRVNVRAVGKR